MQLTSYPVDETFLVDVLCDAIRYPSPLTDEAEEDPGVRGFLGDFLTPQLANLGFEVAGPDEMGNIVGRLAGLGGPTSLFVVFAMTHPAGSMDRPFHPRILDGAPFGLSGQVVVGRGAGEQKGPLASVLTAFHTLVQLGTLPRGDVLVLGLTSGETGRHDALATALKRFDLHPAFGVVAVCTSNDIVVGHMGRVDIEVLVSGESAHSSAPWLGVNALVGACDAIQALNGIDLGSDHPKLGARTITPILLETFPQIAHTIPSQARLVLDWRMLPGDTLDQTAADLRLALQAIGPCRTEVRLGNSMLASEVDIDSFVVKALREAIIAVGGEPGMPTYMSAATDTGYLNHVGIPAVCFGPGDIKRAHTDHDLVEISEAVSASRILARLLVG